MYKPVQKKNSSWTPTTVQKKGKSPSKLGHFSIQPKLHDTSAPSQEIGEYSRDSADRLAANVMRGLQAKEQEQSETPTVQRQSESRKISVADIVNSTNPTLTPSTLSPQIRMTSGVLPENPIQRQCAECAKEEEEHKGEERNDLDEIGIQTKLTVGAPGDAYEQEADQVAAQVMSMPDNSPHVQKYSEANYTNEIWKRAQSIKPVVQRVVDPRVEMGQMVQRAHQIGRNQASSLEANNPNEIWQRAQSIKPVVQRQVDPRVQMGQMIQRAHQIDGNQASGDLESRLNASKGGGSPLSEGVRGFMEPRFGADFSGVRVHTDGEAVQMNQELGAQAFTHGSDVYFGQGKKPGNNELTAHELTHVVQQTGVVQRQMSPACRQTNRYPGNLEHETIEQDYQQNLNPNSATEFSIPGSGPNGGIGYADIVDLNAHAIYEIKTYLGSPQGVIEAERYRQFAQQNCDPNAPWHVGMQYPYRVIPLNTQQELVAQQYPLFPGVITYYTRRRQRRPQPVPVPAPEREPATDRRTALEQIAEFVKQVIQSGENAEQAARRFLAEHPEIKYFLIGAAVIIVVATLIEDILTLGGGIADDPASFAIAWVLVRVAQTAP
jgi:hypothetical protein